MANIRRFLGFGLLFMIMNALQILVVTAILLQMYWPLGLVVLASTVPITVALALTTDLRPTAASLAGFAYVGLVSMFLGFIPWYAGLAMGGIARAGQTQLAQPLLTLLWAWLLLGVGLWFVTWLLNKRAARDTRIDPRDLEN